MQFLPMYWIEHHYQSWQYAANDFLNVSGSRKGVEIGMTSSFFGGLSLEWLQGRDRLVDLALLNSSF